VNPAIDDECELAGRLKRNDGRVDEDDGAIHWSDCARFGLGGEQRDVR
jgi:hypothetical protein